MKRAIKFNVGLAIQTAWDHIWKENLETRASGNDYRNRSYYTTATDIERKVRAFAYDTQRGDPWGTHPYGSSTIRFTGNLFEAVRDWVRGEIRVGRILVHNFGRGHISGQRLRPAGQPMSEAETKTIEKKAQPYKPAPIHFKTGNGHGYGSPPLCISTMRKLKGQRAWGWKPSRAWTTDDREKVNCKRCLNILNEKPV
jgi:hypothetical protein